VYRRVVRFSSFDEVLQRLDAIDAAGDRARTREGWALPQVLSHCAQSVELSIEGFPVMRAALFRGTIGRIVRARFLSRGAMSHDRTAVIPGAEPLGDVPLAASSARLRRSIDRFRAHSGPLAPHFVFGSPERSDYERLHAFHIADHLVLLEM
jgi:hypothetical protein